MGWRGARGAEAGGVVLAQDEATSAVWGMPGRVVEAGICAGGCRCERLPEELMSRGLERKCGTGSGAGQR